MWTVSTLTSPAVTSQMLVPVLAPGYSSSYVHHEAGCYIYSSAESSSMLDEWAAVIMLCVSYILYASY